MPETKITAEPGTPFIDIEREFDAPRELVFRAFTEPDLLAKWLGPKRLEMVVEKLEARDGGSWRYYNVDSDGSEYGFHGVFHTVSPELMIQTFEFEGAPGHVNLDKLVLEERDGRTIVRSHTTCDSVESRDAMVESGMSTGVEEGYEKLDELLASIATTA